MERERRRDACTGVLHELRLLATDPRAPVSEREGHIRAAMCCLDWLASTDEGSRRLRVELGSLFDVVDDPGELAGAVNVAVCSARALRDSG